MMNTKPSMLSFKARAKEGGQALVLIAMLIVILLGFLGLAIDGGGMFLLWRDAQNAVDSAAMQAAFAYCTSNKDFESAIDAGLNAADANGFDNNGVDNWVTVVAAPNNRRPTNVTTMDTNSVMLVTIRAVKPAYFIQLVYGGPLEVTVDTIGACNPASESIYEGYAMFAMGSNGLCGYSDTPNTGSTAQISPNGSRQHYFGPWFSNGNASVGGGGGGITFYDGGGVDFVGGTAGFDSKAENEDGSAVVNNQVSQISYFPPLYDIEQFMPANTTYTDNLGVQHTTGTSDGQYYAEADAQGSEYTTYLPNGGALNGTLNGLYVAIGDVSLKGTIGPEGVTIVAMGDIKSTGQLNTANSSWHPFVGGLTLFSMSGQDSPNCATNNSTAISFSGSSIIGFGILYAPYSGISMSGSDGAWCGALIANAIDRSGSDTWVFGQTIPEVSRLVSLGVPSEFHQYAGRTCDYINADTPPNYFLGD